MKVFSKYISKHLLSFYWTYFISCCVEHSCIRFYILQCSIKKLWKYLSTEYAKGSGGSFLFQRHNGRSRKNVNNQLLWAMYLNTEGSCNWTVNLPEEIPTEYSIQDIAIFSRGYLKDYPVFVWSDENGLLVIGYPQNSYMKITSNYYPIDTVRKVPLFFSASLYSTCWFCFSPIHVLKRKSAKIQSQLYPRLQPCQKGKASTFL